MEGVQLNSKYGFKRKIRSKNKIDSKSYSKNQQKYQRVITYDSRQLGHGKNSKKKNPSSKREFQKSFHNLQIKENISSDIFLHRIIIRGVLPFSLCHDLLVTYESHM